MKNYYEMCVIDNCNDDMYQKFNTSSERGIIEKELKEKEKQDFVYNLLKEIIQFNVLQPEVKETDNGYSYMSKVVLEVRRNLENQERQQLRNWILKECFPKELKTLKAIKKAFNSSSIYTNKLKDSLECGWITQEEYDLIKEELLCQSEKGL